MVDANQLPGFATPDDPDPGPRQPGPSVPDPPLAGAVAVSATGVAVDATGTTAVGTPDGYAGEVLRVTVTPTAADFSFNVLADGTSLFAAAQSPAAAAEETFEVPVNSFDGDAPDLDIEVTAASATGGATADVTIETGVAER